LDHVDLPDGGQVSYDYFNALAADSAGRYHSSVVSSTKLDSSRYVDSKSYFDGRGALTQAFNSYTSGDGWSITDVEYDSMGRAYRGSNPYYCTSNYGSCSINPSGIWTTRTFDILGRVTQVTMPRGDDANPSYTTSVQTTYEGEVTTVTDQAGKQRRQITDALGRVIRLDEPNSSGSLGAVSSPAQATSYMYDVLGNLVKITQGDQQRYFKYDSLSRLIRERQVEQSVNSSYNLSDSLTGNSSWTRKFEYNSHGLLTHGYDARGIQTDFYYDDLNRVTLIDYSDSTPDARYYYDSQTLPSGAPSYTHGSANGRLIGMTYGSSSSTTGTYFGYDNMGRVNVQKQVTGSNTYSLSYTYNLAGLLATETYPSNRVLTHSYDNAGRLSQISDGTTTLASSFGYAPSGGMLSETWGNGAVHSVAYNNAMQVSQIKLKQSSSGSELQRYDYLYGQVTQSNGSVDKSKNNGQIGRIDGIINGSSTKEWEQRFSYDELGRLSTAAEYQQGTGSTPSWKQEFTYDRYGNRFQSGSGNTVVDFTPVVSSDISVSTNRFISSGSTPITYDASGNITQDVKFRFMNYGYDANGRQVSTSATNSDLSQTSVYDCAGQRVQTTSFGATHTMVYDIFGQQVADYNGATLEKENIYRGGQVLAVYEAASTCYLTIANFVTAFYQGALHRNPSSTELLQWTAALSKAQAQGNARLIKVAQDLGTAVFTSSEYTNTDHSTYVNDLYAAFLQRTADSGGYAYWMAALSGGSTFTQVRNGFAYSLEFQNNVVRLCPGTSSSTSTSANLKYVLTDLQGSTRAVMDTSATITARHDYLPFGEEIFAGVGLRTTTQKYSVTNKVRQRFAMTERDEATGLDHTWFRKYDSFAGRWTTPDPLGGSIANPQGVNRYTYAANDPINLVDPLGLDPSDHEPGHSEPDGPCPPGSPCSVDIYPGPSPVLGGTAGPEVFIPREPPSEGPGVDPPTGGDPQKPSKKETFLEALKRCVYEKFGVTLEGFTSATSKRDGVFKGTGYNRYSQRNERLKIITNVWYGSSLRLATLNNDYRRNNPDKGQPLVGPGQRVLGVTLSYGLGLSMYQSPFLNYLANDLPKEYNTDEWRRRQQVHELGHSLADITGNFKKGDEAGEILESCVFGSTANQR
jgi:RHS repeat-associated protein